jgi:hypothetical protein
MSFTESDGIKEDIKEIQKALNDTINTMTNKDFTYNPLTIFSSTNICKCQRLKKIINGKEHLKTPKWGYLSYSNNYHNGDDYNHGGQSRVWNSCSISLKIY